MKAWKNKLNCDENFLISTKLSIRLNYEERNFSLTIDVFKKENYALVDNDNH